MGDNRSMAALILTRCTWIISNCARGCVGGYLFISAERRFASVTSIQTYSRGLCIRLASLDKPGIKSINYYPGPAYRARDEGAATRKDPLFHNRTRPTIRCCLHVCSTAACK